jgi:hypothetical protein
MDISGYYYGRSWACSDEESILSLSSAIFRVPRHQMTIARRPYKFRERILRVMNYNVSRTIFGIGNMIV